MPAARRTAALRLALLALLPACTSSIDGPAPSGQPECAFGTGEAAPLLGPRGVVVAGTVNGEPV